MSLLIIVYVIADSITSFEVNFANFDIGFD